MTAARSAVQVAELKVHHPDLTVTPVAGISSLSKFPICGDFDNEGNLFIAESSGSNAPVEQQLLERPHSILKFTDTNGDGTFDKGIVFADKMMFPEGLLWHEGSVYVAAPPSIWKLTDTDNDGVADERVEWFQGKTLTGCANDLHGPYAGPDGLLYWCKGAFAEQTYDRPGMAPFVTRAAHIFRAPTDLAFIEPVMTGGMDNPVEVCFTPEGERIFTTTFFQHPGGGKRDGLVHAIYGGVYGKVHDVLEGHPRTGELMPVMTHMGPAAPCGLLRYESGHLADEFRNNLFAASFNLHKITRHETKWEGARLVTEDHDFLTCNNTDFHPTDIIEDADGSLLIIDTGGWYKICCPTSQLYKPEIYGGIYRVSNPSRKSKLSEDPWGKKMDWPRLSGRSLIDLTSDDRVAVQRQAVSELVKRGDSSVAACLTALISSASDHQRLQAVWTLTRINTPSAHAALITALKDRSAQVRHAAAHGVGLWRVNSALATLHQMLDEEDQSVRRVAAEAIGRIGNPAIVSLLMRALGDASEDRVLEHSLIYALIEINDPASVRAWMSLLDDMDATRAGMLALDQMANQTLKAREVTQYLNHSNLSLRETATWIAKRHPEWATEMFSWFPEQIAAKQLDESDLSRLSSLLGSFMHQETLRDLIAGMVLEETTPAASRRMLLDLFTSSNPGTPPDSWTASAVQLANHPDPSIAEKAIHYLKKIKNSLRENATLLASLQIAYERRDLPDNVRLDLLSVVSVLKNGLSDPQFQWVHSKVTEPHPVFIKSLAAQVLSETRLTHMQQSQIAGSVHKWAPLDFPRALQAVSKSAIDQVGIAFLRAVTDHELFGYLSTAMLEEFLKPFSERVKEEAKPVFQSLTKARAEQSENLEKWMGLLPQGEVARGQMVFNQEKTACTACHEIGYLGGDLGPDLTKIGQIRSERDLLEAILYPSASFVRSYEPVDIFTNDGEVYSGIIKNEGTEVIDLATGPGARIQIQKNEIKSMKPGEFSVMPSGLDQVLSTQDLADLIAFLKATKW